MPERSEAGKAFTKLLDETLCSAILKGLISQALFGNSFWVTHAG